jgi:hypothetical protein
MTTTTVDTIIDTLLNDIGGMLEAILPTVLGFVAIMTVLWFGVRFILGKVRRAR